MSRKSRRILITGAGSGIGRAIAIEASRRGMRVALCGRREQPLAETYAALRPGDHIAIPCDVLNANDRRRLIQVVGQRWGAIDVLINNAGLIQFGPVRELVDGDAERLVATNLTAPICMVRDCLQLLTRGVKPQIANMGSLLGSIPYPLFAAYSATKSGLHGFSTALRRELAPLKIGVTHISARGTDTESAQILQPYAKSLEMRFDKPEAVAVAVLDGLAQRKNEIYPKGIERLFMAAQAITPAIVDRAIASQLRRASAEGLPIH